MKQTVSGVMTLPENVNSLPVSHYNFEVLLDGKPVGGHQFSFTALKNGYRVISVASFQVEILRIPVYRYQHRSEEVWRNGSLHSIDSQTNANGKKYQVTGSRKSSTFRLRVNRKDYQLANPTLSTFAYWQPAVLDRELLLNSQTGTLVEVVLNELGESPLPWNEAEQAETIVIETGEGDITTWYQQGHWVGMRALTNNGHEINYRPISIASSGDSEHASEQAA